jgi:hypothetical protein
MKLIIEKINQHINSPNKEYRLYFNNHYNIIHIYKCLKVFFPKY